MVSAVRRLLDELSWEGNARKYRDGGLGLENVLTVEVFQALDFLPRQAFLGRVLAGASGAALLDAQSDIEQAVVDILPGDLTHPDLRIAAQPDVVIDSPDTFIVVEAKRLRPSSFQPDQLAKELILTAEHARGRRFTLLLVLGAPPPVRVRGHGPLDIRDAVQLGQERISARHGRQVAVPDPLDTMVWTTWAEIGAQVAAAASSSACCRISSPLRGITDHLKNAFLAGIAWTMTTAVSPWTYPTSRMTTPAVAPTIIVNPSPRSQTRIGFRYAWRIPSSSCPCFNADGAMIGSPT